MSDYNKTGGTAFPLVIDESTTEHSEGMTLRDYFAAHAMQGFSANSEFAYESTNTIARWAFSQADSMLEARRSK